MSPLRSLELEALGDAIPPALRGNAELRPWLPRRIFRPERGESPRGDPFPLDPGARRPFLTAALLEARDGVRALELWQKLRPGAGELGALPVVVGSPEDVSVVELRQPLEEPDDARERLAVQVEAAAALSGERVLEELGRARGPLPGALQLEAELPAIAFAPREEPFLFVDEIQGRTQLALVATGSPSLVPVLLGFGGFASCPKATEIAAVLRHWDARFGPLEVVFAGAATLELEVARPPRTAGEVRALALEQFALCPGIVTHGSGTIDKLAHQLAGSRRWAFWWD